ISFWIAFKPSLTASISFLRSSVVGCCAEATRAAKRQVRKSPTDRLDFRRFMARSFPRYTNGNMRPWPRPGDFPFLQAVHCSDPAPALYAHTLVSVVSHLAMSNDALPVQQENGRRAAYAIGS